MNPIGENKKAITLRWEEDGGSNDRVIQAVGCYAKELYGRCRIGDPFLAEVDFDFMSLEENSNDSRPILTTAPGPCGESENMYDGNPIVVYDVGGGGEAGSKCFVYTGIIQ